MPSSPTAADRDTIDPVFWKLSMGPGGSGREFAELLVVLDWIRQGVVLVHKNTPAMGQSKTRQGEDFVHKERTGDYFYLCHGNPEPSVILLGQFTGPADILSPRILTHGEWGKGWAARPFRWIKTAAKSAHCPHGDRRWWMPAGNSTFVEIKPDELREFEKHILFPFFEERLANFGIRG